MNVRWKLEGLQDTLPRLHQLHLGNSIVVHPQWLRLGITLSKTHQGTIHWKVLMTQLWMSYNSVVSYGRGIQWKSVSFPHIIHPAWCAAGYLVHSSWVRAAPIALHLLLLCSHLGYLPVMSLLFAWIHIVLSPNTCFLLSKKLGKGSYQLIILKELHQEYFNLLHLYRR